MKFRDYINEVFDTKVKITDYEVNSDSANYWFDIDGREFELIADKRDDIWYIFFTDDSLKVQVTNKGDNFKIFASVIQVMKKFLKDITPNKFKFVAGVKSRQKLYDKFSKLIEKQSKYKLVKTKIVRGEKHYIFERT